MSPRCRLRYVLKAVTLTNFNRYNQRIYTDIRRVSNVTAELRRTNRSLHTCNYSVLVGFCFKTSFKNDMRALFDAIQFDLDAIMPMRMAPPATALYSNVEKD